MQLTSMEQRLAAAQVSEYPVPYQEFSLERGR